MKSTESGMNILKGLLDKKVAPEDIDMALETAVQAALDEFDKVQDEVINSAMKEYAEGEPDNIRFFVTLRLPDNQSVLVSIIRSIRGILDGENVDMGDKDFLVHDANDDQTYYIRRQK